MDELWTLVEDLTSALRTQREEMFHSNGEDWECAMFRGGECNCGMGPIIAKVDLLLSRADHKLLERP